MDCVNEFEQDPQDILAQINRVSRTLSAELDLQKLVQAVTDAATSVSKAQFGAFFYNVTKASGEAYMLYTISGVPREAFSNFPMPRNTAVFAPTFTGERIMRSDDITKDKNYGKNAPRHGMPEGHLPVRSYLAVPVISRSGEVLGGLFFGHSSIGVFTEREEQLIAGIASHAAVAIDNARLYQRSQDAIRARDQFLSICSHELKTPITSLKLQVQLARRQAQKSGAPSPEKFNELCTAMDHQLNQMGKLVDEMLDVTRIETGKLNLSFEIQDLSHLVRDVSREFAPQLKELGLEIQFQGVAGLSAEFDGDRIAQVIRNLISNAIKYGDGKAISIETDRLADHAFVAITDQGIGIPANERERIFKRFERVASPNNISGLGLGLFISQQIAEAHGGMIRVESEVGAGSTFTLDLPVKR